MGCNKSANRVAPETAGAKKRKNVSRFTLNLQNLWRRMVRLGVVKVGPANGDEPGPTHEQLLKAAWAASEISQDQVKVLQELQVLGIVSFNASASGAVSYSIGDPTGDNGAKPLRRPPARLAGLKRVPSLPDAKKAEKLEKKMKAAEARRKKTQDEIMERLRSHSRRGQHHQEAAAEAERALKQKTAAKIASKQAAFEQFMEEREEVRLEQARCKSRAGDHARETAKDLEEQFRSDAVENLAKKRVRFEEKVLQQEAMREELNRSKSRMEERAKEIAEDLGKESKEKADQKLAHDQRVAETNRARRERFRSKRVILNDRHRENVRKALARRIADEEEQARIDMEYEIETAIYSDEEEGDEFYEPELQWIM